SPATHRVNMLPGNRFELITLGRLSLVGDTGEEDASLAKRRFKLALLSVLALARRPVSRERLIEMFWGDQEEARARHSLSNALSSLRRALGQRAISTRDADVSLTSDANLSVDALEFAEAAEGRDFARAAELYGGPFLDGVHLESETAAFEQWMSRERRRLEALFVQGCAQYAPTLARARRGEECEQLAHRWLEAEPLAADAAIFLLNAVKAPATRSALARALQEYDTLRARLEREYELPPDKRVIELAGSIRDQMATAPDDSAPAPIAPPIVAIPPAPPVALLAPPDIRPALPPVSVEAPAVGALELPPSARPRRAARRWWPLAAAAAVALAGVALVRWSDRTVATTHPSIAIFEMPVRSADSSNRWLAEGLPEMMVSKLARQSGVEVVPTAQLRAVVERSGRRWYDRFSDAEARELARRVGATIVARGSIGQDGRNYVLDMALLDVSRGTNIHSAVFSDSSALGLADQASARILRQHASGRLAAASPTWKREVRTHTSTTCARRCRLCGTTRGACTRARCRDSAGLGGPSPRCALRRDVAMWTNDTATITRILTMQRFSNQATEFDRIEQACDAAAAGDRERRRHWHAICPRISTRPSARTTCSWNAGHARRARGGGTRGVAAAGLDSLAMTAGTGPCTPCNAYHSLVSLRWQTLDLPGAAEWARPLDPTAARCAGGVELPGYLYLPPATRYRAHARDPAVSLSGGETWTSTDYVRMLTSGAGWPGGFDHHRDGVQSRCGAPVEAWDLRSTLSVSAARSGNTRCWPRCPQPMSTAGRPR
ncbi:MAG: BTAD domain-containing putative transcriptional regulator, partial [Gemmatimonadaceae bacterium]